MFLIDEPNDDLDVLVAIRGANAWPRFPHGSYDRRGHSRAIRAIIAPSFVRRTTSGIRMLEEEQEGRRWQQEAAPAA
ncbi:MAG: hypothetical protein IIC94_10555 [Chloroflexi bacterium]|nr:hypothetical protein [Chloroflexota bacterium]